MNENESQWSASLKPAHILKYTTKKLGSLRGIQDSSDRKGKKRCETYV